MVGRGGAPDCALIRLAGPPERSLEVRESNNGSSRKKVHERRVSRRIVEKKRSGPQEGGEAKDRGRRDVRMEGKVGKEGGGPGRPAGGSLMLRLEGVRGLGPDIE